MMHRKIEIPFFWALLFVTLSSMTVIYLRFSSSPSIPTKVTNGKLSNSVMTPFSNNILGNPIGFFLKTLTSPEEVQATFTTSYNNLLSRLQNDDLKISQRRHAAFELAMIPSSSIILELNHLFPMLPPYVKAAIAEGLGENSHPDARHLILTLLENEGKDAIAMRGLIRGAAALGDGESLKIIANIITDSQQSESVREEAARELGVNSNPMAFKLLTDAIENIDDPELEKHLLEGFGNLSVNDTSDFFQEYLASNETPEELRVAAVEALSNGADDPTSLLLQFTSDQNPEVRAAAAWALSDTQITGNHGEQLMTTLEQEPDANVRKYLYQALTHQTNLNTAQLMEQVKFESNVDTRLSGYDLIASMVNQAANEELTVYFNSSVVSELKVIALNGKQPQQLASVISLSRAKSSESIKALQNITMASKDEMIIRAADNALGNINE